ncbi:MAG: hypothetical protein HZC26_00305 [Candidatus Magasanikbacteria bacterium]|nr:hypothetical protein [Candidatus Magasanikbacteria bacterium]
MKNKILFSLLFIFLVSGFLFFKVELVQGEGGICNCVITDAAGDSSETTANTYEKDCISQTDANTGQQFDCKWQEKTTVPFGGVKGTCTCAVTDTTKGQSSEVKSATYKEDCVSKNDASTGQEFQCAWQEGQGICKCDIVNTDTGDVEYNQDITDESEAACDQMQDKQDGALSYENCFWFVGGEEGAPASVTTEGGEAIDLPSVSGLNQLKNTDVKAVFGNIISVAMGLLGSIALALFAYAGVLWMLAGGNAERSTQAKNIVVWATLGLFVIFASYTIVSFIFSAVE